MYLETKGDREASDMAKQPIYEALVKYPILKFIRRKVMQSPEREEFTVRILKKSVKEKSAVFITEENGVGPGRLVNAANYLSTKYLEDSDSFSEQVKESKEFVDRLLRK